MNVTTYIEEKLRALFVMINKKTFIIRNNSFFLIALIISAKDFSQVYILIILIPSISSLHNFTL